MDDYEMKQNKINEDRYKADVNKQIRNLESEIKSFNENVLDLKANQDALRVSLHADFDNFELRVMDKIKSYRDLIDQSKKLSDNFVKSYSKDIEEMKREFVLESDFSRKINDVIQSSFDSMKEMRDIKSNLNEAMRKVNGDIQDKLDHVMRSLPVVESPKEVEERNNKLDLLTLDVSNANVRSVNCEKKLGMIDKKLEQINLILKQINLGKE